MARSDYKATEDVRVTSTAELSAANALATAANLAATTGDYVIELAGNTNYNTAIRPAANGTSLTKRIVYVWDGVGSKPRFSGVNNAWNFDNRSFCVVDGIHVTGGTVDNWTNYSISQFATMQSCFRCYVLNCTCIGCSSNEGIDVGGNSTADCSYCVFDSNYFEGIGWFGPIPKTDGSGEEIGEIVLVQNSPNFHNNIFSNNTCRHGGHGFWVISGYDNVIIGNDMDNDWSDYVTDVYQGSSGDNWGDRVGVLRNEDNRTDFGWHVWQGNIITNVKDAPDTALEYPWKNAGQYSLIRDNVIHECWGHGIGGAHAAASSLLGYRMSVYNNTIYRVGECAQYQRWTSTDASNAPAWCFDDLSVMNNIFANNRMGAAINSGSFDSDRWSGDGDNDLYYETQTKNVTGCRIQGNVFAPYNNQTPTLRLRWIDSGSRTLASYEAGSPYTGSNTVIDSNVSATAGACFSATPGSAYSSYAIKTGGPADGAAVPLAYTTSAGTGKRVPCTRPWLFTDDKGIDSNYFAGDTVVIGSNQPIKVTAVGTRTGTNNLWIDIETTATWGLGNGIQRYGKLDSGAYSTTNPDSTVTTANDDLNKGPFDSASTGNSINVTDNDVNALGSTDDLTITDINGGGTSAVATDQGGSATVVSGTPDTISYDAPTVTVTTFDTFTYTIYDGVTSASASVRVTVNPTSGGGADTLIIHDEFTATAAETLLSDVAYTIQPTNTPSAVWQGGNGAISDPIGTADWGGQFQAAESLDTGQTNIKIVCHWKWTSGSGENPGIVVGYRSSDPAAGIDTNYLGDSGYFAYIRWDSDTWAVYDRTVSAGVAIETAIGGPDTLPVTLVGQTECRTRVTINNDTHKFEYQPGATGDYHTLFSDTITGSKTGTFVSVGQKNKDATNPLLLEDFMVYTLGTGAGSSIAAADDTLPDVQKNSDTTTFSKQLLFNNDTDALGNSPPVNELIIVTGSLQPQTNCTAALNSDGNIEFTPNTGFSGVATFTYIIEDTTDNSQSEPATVSVNVVNTAPVATARSYTVGTDQTILIYLDTGITDPANKGDGNPVATDADGDSLSYSVVTSPSHGANIIGNNGSGNAFLAYDNNGDGVATDSLTIKAVDPDGAESNTVTLSFIIQSPNAINDAAIVERDSADNVISVLDNDENPTGGSFVICCVTQPANGTVTRFDGYVTYTPDTGFQGVDTFTYTVIDANGSTDTATVTVTVFTDNPITATPITAYATTIAESGDTTYTMHIDLSSVVNQAFPGTVTYSIVDPPATGTVSFSGDLLTYQGVDLNTQTMIISAVSDTNEEVEISITITHRSINQVRASIIPKLIRGRTL